MTKTCPNCKKVYTPDLDDVLPKKGESLIQNQYPKYAPYQREQLQTGLCSDKCWDEYLGVQ